MDSFNLGRPLTGEAQRPAPRDGFDEGEHGAGIGLSGGPRGATGATQTSSSFVPADLNNADSLPIADKFMGQSGTYGGEDAVSGAYETGGTRDALTGQATAFSTGPGVGYEGENLRSSGRAGGNEGYVGTGVGAVGGAGGHYSAEDGNQKSSGYKKGAAFDDPSRGKPVADVNDIDTGNKHSLVWQEETQQYVHRRDLE